MDRFNEPYNYDRAYEQFLNLYQNMAGIDKTYTNSF